MRALHLLHFTNTYHLTICLTLSQTITDITLWLCHPFQHYLDSSLPTSITIALGTTSVPQTCPALPHGWVRGGPFLPEKYTLVLSWPFHPWMAFLQDPTSFHESPSNPRPQSKSCSLSWGALVLGLHLNHSLCFCLVLQLAICRSISPALLQALAGQRSLYFPEHLMLSRF